MARVELNELREVPLEKRRVHVIRPHDEEVLHVSVPCLIKGSEMLDRCRSCARLVEESSRALVCRFPAELEQNDRRCGLLVPRETVALDAELPAREARALLENASLPSAPVLDDEGHLIGMATLVELTKAMRDADAEVEDVVEATTAVDHHLGVTALARLMEERRLERVSVVDDEGRLLGVVSVHQVMGWLRARLREE